MSTQEVNQREETRKIEEEQSYLENWLPITATRKANWWHSAFHNVTAMVGAGVLGLPFAMSQIGWYPGMIALLVSWLVTLYSLWQLVELHELVPGTRFDRYSELGKHVFGPKRGYWFIMPQQLSVQVCTNIVYMVTGGKSMMKFMSIVAPSFTWIRQTYYIMFFGFCQLCLSQTPDFNSLKGVSLLAALMSFCYSAMACISCILKGVKEHHHIRPDYGVRASTTVGIVFDVFNAIGTIAFSFAGHSVVLEIQATIPSTPEKPSNKPMWKGVKVAYYIVAFCYFSVAIAGFWAFGNVVEDDVLVSLEHPSWLIATANLMVFIHVLGSYQVFAMSVFDIIESTLVKKLNFSPGLCLRMSARSIYVALTCFVGVMIPFFGGLIGFIGGLFFAPISYSIPGIMWLRVHKPKSWSKHWIASWISIIVGTAILVFAPAGGLRTIILSYKSYKLFS